MVRNAVEERACGPMDAAFRCGSGEGDGWMERGAAMSRFKFCRAALGAASAFTLLLPASAGAQYYPAQPVYPAHPAPGFGLMPPHEAEALVRSLGLTPIAEPRVHGPVILIHAVGQEGSQVRVTVDRRNGRLRQIVRIGPSAPHVATLPPGPQYDNEVEEIPVPPRPVPNAGYAPYPPAPPGPQVITRDGIQTQGLPPPGPDPRVVTREPEITGSIPRAASPRTVDPLVGVPPEFRNRAARDTPAKDDRVAARPPEETAPRATPMPRPRPADAPTIARREPAPAPAPTKPEAAKPAAPESAAKPNQPTSDIPVQGLE
jgi:hypothetical protein